LVNIVSVVGIRDEATLSRHAVLALEHGAALGAIIVSTSSVDRASFIGNVVVVHPLEGVVSLTTMAAIISRARDQDLRGDVDIRPSSFSIDLNSIRESRSSGMGPA
jgi:hypothetical protein